MPHTLLLTVGADLTLLNTRTQILQQAGYIVRPVSSVRDAIAQFYEGDFDLVLLCHSLPAEDRERLTRLVHSHSPMTPVVQISALDFQGDSTADAMLDPNPEAMLAGLTAVLSNRRDNLREA